MLERWIKSGILLFWLFSFSCIAQLKNVEVKQTPLQAEILLSFTKTPSYSIFNLNNPYRTVLDLDGVKSTAIPLPLRVGGDQLLTKIRVSHPKNDHSLRLVFETTADVRTVLKPRQDKKQLKLTLLLAKNSDLSYQKPNETGNAEIVDLKLPKRSSVEATVLTPAITSSMPASRAKPQISSPIPKQNKSSGKIVIAIDAGHGGQDPGAIGPTGLWEKQVTLAVAKKLQQRFNQDPMFKAILTRNSDYFISVLGRSDVARKHSANLLISIHADAAPNKNIKGASVWVLSNKRANSELGRWLEQHEKQSELLGGAGDLLTNRAEDRYLSQAVLDLQFVHSQRVGYDVAVEVLRQLGRIGRLHKTVPEHASLGVLRSPDIPSLLVETGFISNPQEEKLLKSKQYQDKIANAIYVGIKQYFLLNPLERKSLAKNVKSNSNLNAPSNVVRHAGTSENYRIHIVLKGETLSEIAQHYKVTVRHLMQLNRLKNETIWIDQRLRIPNQ